MEASAMGRGLSEQQKDAICWIGEELILQYRKFPHAEVKRLCAKCPSVIQTESGWASWSRTKRRLRERGLIYHWTYSAIRGLAGHTLTPSGWEIFRQLTGQDVPIELIEAARYGLDGEG
jgi:hypothetical protein